MDLGLELESFSGFRGGGTARFEDGIELGNRLRTTDRAIRITHLGLGRHELFSGPVTTQLHTADDERLTHETLELSPDEPVRAFKSAVLVPSETTFYVSVQVPKLTSVPYGLVEFQVHPQLRELGCWSRQLGGGQLWAPSSGPKHALTWFRFTPGPENQDGRIRKIVDLASLGMTDKEIAQRLEMNSHTIDAVWRRLKKRWGTSSRTGTVTKILQIRARQEKEDLEAERDRLAAELWLARHPSGWELDEAVLGRMRSWPMV